MGKAKKMLYHVTYCKKKAYICQSVTQKRSLLHKDETKAGREFNNLKLKNYGKPKVWSDP